MNLPPEEYQIPHPRYLWPIREIWNPEQPSCCCCVSGCPVPESVFWIRIAADSEEMSSSCNEDNAADACDELSNQVLSLVQQRMLKNSVRKWCSVVGTVL